MTNRRPALNKQRIARMLGQRSGLSNQMTAAVLEHLIAIISEEIAAAGRIEIENFLTLEVQTKTRNVRTADLIDPTQETFFVLKCRPGQYTRRLLQELSSKTVKK